MVYIPDNIGIFLDGETEFLEKLQSCGDGTEKEESVLMDRWQR